MQYHVKSVNETLPDEEGNVNVNVVEDIVEAAYTESPTFTGTLSPSGTPTNRWQAEITKGFCKLIIVLQFPTDGIGLTACSIPLPATAPAPKIIAGMSTNNGDFVYPALGMLTRTNRTFTSTMSRVQLSVDTGVASGYSLVGAFGSTTVGTVTVIINYPIALTP